MTKLPISTIQINPNAKNDANDAKNPICLWCHKPLEPTGPILTNILPPIIKTKRLVCIYHPHDIMYTFKKYLNVRDGLTNHPVEEPWTLNHIALNISPTLRLFYSYNKLVSLQKCNGELSTWGFVTLLTDKEDSWPHNLNYNDLIAKVKGYLPFL